MSNHRILLAEDDSNLGSLLSEFLRVKGYTTDLFVNGEAALAGFEEGKFDICILDVMMPRKDGFTVAREIREQGSAVPILFLTARNMLADKGEGFGLGGDDYLTKPFNMEELLMRIQALLRRSQNAAAAVQEVEATSFKIGAYTFDAVTRHLSHGGESKRMTSREAELLKMLCLSMNQLLTRENALKTIWGDDSYFNARSMDVFITKLRKYLKADPSVEIQNVHGTGYKLIVIS